MNLKMLHGSTAYDPREAMMSNSAKPASPLTSCRFCDFLNSPRESPGVDSPWLKSASYAAMTSIGALVPGWTLVCPTEHKLNMADAYRSEALWEFTSKVESRLSRRFGEVRLFEHGARHSGSLTGCGTDHAHLHLVPLEFQLSVEAIRFDRTLHWAKCSISEIDERTAGQEYLFVADRYEGRATAGLLCVLEANTSQFFRRVIATRLGMSEFFDYRRYPMSEIAEETARKLHGDTTAVTIT